MPQNLPKLNWKKTFVHLSRPPIVEAAIHWLARAQKPLAESALRLALAERLPGYSKCEPIQRFGWMAKLTDIDKSPDFEHYPKDFIGFRLISGDGRDIVQFTRDGLMFSRTKPYDDWEQFTAAAKHVWRIFQELAEPVEIQRLGVRFINQLSDATSDNLDEFLRDPPTRYAKLPLKEFLYQSTFAVPGHPLGVRVIKVMQSSMPGLPQSSGLFLDCDVFTTEPLKNGDTEMEELLPRMRWLKNKVFFSLLTERAIELHKKALP